MYKLINIKEGNELSLAGATATILKNGVEIGTVEDLGGWGRFRSECG
ncbi:MAG TPA: hypothetical protein VM577_03060 [Anaerovoracaceae bacterium]|nr:hypothetical protein [Anaerovoracaceae bacterium]